MPLARPIPAIALLAAAAAADTAPAAPPTLREAITGGTPSVFVRLRHEHIEADGFAADADATTARVALGYATKPWHGLSVSAQYEGILGIGQERYNSTANGRTRYPVVVDQADTHELQQAYVAYAPAFAPRTAIKAGRQEISLDNQRFIGSVAWRQDWQSFDAASLTSSWWKPLSVFYAYLDDIHRIVPETAAGGRLDSDSHLINVAYADPRFGKLSAYAYLIDFENAPAAFLVQSTATVGARLAGSAKISPTWSVPYQLEFAAQRDYGDNPVDQDNRYGMAELGVARAGIAAKVGIEVLEGQDQANDRFTTPLATLHAFNGWADMFLNTPNAGLRDAWVTVGGPLRWLDGLSFAAFYHDFRSDDGATRFGDELDLLLQYQAKAIDPNLTIGAKFAAYRAGDGAGAAIPGSAVNVDTSKLWLWAQYAF